MIQAVPRVLVVEDDCTIAHMISKLFGLWHWDAAKALTLAAAMVYIADPFDLIVLDLMLPDGDGIEVLREVRSRKLTPTVVVTTAKTLSNIQEVIDLKPELLLIKPFVFEPLKDIAEQIALRHQEKIVYRVLRSATQ
jgi:DNA-binding response OmpR family regulator